MDLRQYLIASGSAAMTMLADAGQLSAHELINAGAEDTHFKRIIALYDVYFGRTKSTRKQTDARNHATRNRLGFDRLEAIEVSVGKLKNKQKSWSLRRDLARFVGNHHDYQRHAKAKLIAYNADADNSAGNGSRPSVKFTHHKGTDETTMTLRAASDTLREFETASRARADEQGISVAEAAAQQLSSGTGRPNYVMKVLVWFDDLRGVLNGEGNDALAVTTTGAVLPVTSLLQKRIDPNAEYIALTPMHGAISVATGRNPLFELGAREAGATTNTGTPPAGSATASATASTGTPSAGSATTSPFPVANTRAQSDAEQSRRASEGLPPIPRQAIEKALGRHGTYKDRALLEAMQTTCAGEGCSVPAAYCEINHNVPFSKGGLSLLSNMCLLCRYHNGKAGANVRYTSIRGTPFRILPGGKLVANQHPLAALSPPRQKHPVPV